MKVSFSDIVERAAQAILGTYKTDQGDLKALPDSCDVVEVAAASFHADSAYTLFWASKTVEAVRLSLKSDNSNAMLTFSLPEGVVAVLVVGPTDSPQQVFLLLSPAATKQAHAKARVIIRQCQIRTLVEMNTLDENLNALIQERFAQSNSSNKKAGGNTPKREPGNKIANEKRSAAFEAALQRARQYAGDEATARTLAPLFM